MADLLMGIDIGTTATKCIILDPEMGIIGSAEASATLNSPRSGWAEEILNSGGRMWHRSRDPV